MLNLNKNTRLFFFQFIFQRNYSTDFELDEFIKQNIKKRPFNKKKLLSLNESFNSNLEKIKGLIDSKIIEKTNKITVFLLYAFCSEYLLNKRKKDINERIYQAFQGFSYPRRGKILQLFVR